MSNSSAISFLPSLVSRWPAAVLSKADPLVLTRPRTGYLPHHFVEIEARRFLSRREFFEALEPLRNQGHRAIVHIGMMDEPLVVEDG